MDTPSTDTQYPFLQDGGEMGEITRNHDWSKTTLGSPNQWPLSLRTTLGILLHSAFPMVLFWGDELICFYNDAFRPSLGLEGKHPAQGKRGQQMWAEIWDFIGPLIEQVMTTGKPVWFEDQLVPFYRNGQLDDIYWTFSYSPAYGDEGRINGVLVTCTETTQQVNMLNQLRLSEQRFQNLIRDASVGIIVLGGEQMQVEIVNQAYARLIDRQVDHLTGQALFSIIPETESVFRPLIDQVRLSGEALYLYDQPFFVYLAGVKKEGYLNLVYQPYKELDGTISGVMVLCQDVTEQVLARQVTEEVQQALREAIELAELGTWQMDLITGHIEYSQRLRAWHGLTPDEVITRERAYQFVRQTDWPRVREAIAQTILPGSDGLYDVEYTLEARPASPERILHAQGKAHLNSQGQTYKISGTVQDVTAQRRRQLALEQQVQERTQELAAVNEELAASNEELTEANQLLSRSNDNLEQFAYVASHDLQEPLRKIQQFGDLLKSQHATSIGEGFVYLDRMQAAASRMSVLINDLLSFSRLTTRKNTPASISLREVLNTVLSDLDLRIQETGAVIETEPLPTLRGDKSQLGQLFQNLLSNALKFRRSAIPPRIRISCQLVKAADLPVSVRSAHGSIDYYQIDVSDNGIGFEPKYVDRIFQVFQRLHGKNEFAGTGIGLAICERVATNHGGTITASSRPGQGATFSVYLPA